MRKARLPKLQLTPAGGLPKADLLERWQALPKDKTITVEPVPYGAKGSSYERDSLRVCGSLPFIDAVLSHLKGLLRYESPKTLLDVAFSEQTEKGSSKRVKGKYVLYLKVKEKARTTRARTAVSLPPRPAAPRPSPPAAPAAPESTALRDARAGLATLGLKPAEAERRLAAAIAQHGPDLDTATYIKLVLNG